MNKITTILIAVLVIINFSSCKKNEIKKSPVIEINELGYNNSKTTYAGSELHIEAEIIAEAKIEKVKIEIHSVNEQKDNNWHIDTVFTEFLGLINTLFHKHLDVAADADTGVYHFHFTVSDMDGQQTSVEELIEVKFPTDTVKPNITINSAPINNQVFNNGDNISISGTISDDKALGGLYIGLVRENQNLNNEQVNENNTITLLHTNNFNSYDLHNFTANINVGASQDNNYPPKDIVGVIEWQTANYYIIVKVKDAFGSNWQYSNHFPIKINI